MRFRWAMGWLNRHPLWTLFAVAATVRLAVVVVISVIAPEGLNPDERRFWSLAGELGTDEPQHWAPRERGIANAAAPLVLLLGMVRRVFGDSMVPPRVLMAVIGALLPVLVTVLAARTLPTRRQALVVGAVVAVWPSYVVFSASLLREPLVWLLILALAWAVTTLHERHGAALGVNLAVILGALASLSALRHHVMLVAVVALVVTAWFSDPLRRVRVGAAVIVIAVAVPLVGVPPFFPGAWAQPAERPSVDQALVALADRRYDDAVAALLGPEVASEVAVAAGRRDVRAVDELLESYETRTYEEWSRTTPRPVLQEVTAIAVVMRLEARVRSGETIWDRYVAGVTERQERMGEQACTAIAHRTSITHPLQVLRRAAVGFPQVLLGPLPGQTVCSRLGIAAQGESLGWTLLLVVAVYGYFSGDLKRRKLLFPLLFAAGLLTVYAIAEGSTGTAFRHRTQIAWVAFIPAVAGAVRMRERLRGPRSG